MFKTTHLIKMMLTAVAACALLLGAPIVGAQQQRSVAVISITDHPSLDAVRDGVKEVLTKAGYIEGKNFRWQYQSAQGNNSIAAQIARKYVGDKPDAIVAISTPAAQTVLANTKTIPIIFTAVTDPVAAKLTQSWKATGTNVTGVSDMLDLDSQIAIIKKVMPNAKRLGVVYNPAEANSIAAIETLKNILPKYDMTLVTAAAPRTVDVGTAARGLVGKVDVFLATTDNNVISAFEAIAAVAQESQIPAFAADGQVVKRGAVAAMGIDYHDIGRQAGRMILRIFDGTAVGTIAPETMKNPKLYINPEAAKKQGLVLSEEFIKSADIVVK